MITHVISFVSTSIPSFFFLLWHFTQNPDIKVWEGVRYTSS